MSLVASIISILAALGSQAMPAVATFETLANSFIEQDICVDQADKAIAGLSPLDPACVKARNLKLGEALPYHKHDWSIEDGSTPGAPLGMQRSDSFPAHLSGVPVTVQTFDFGPPGRSFGIFDPNDGGQIVHVTPAGAAIILTQDLADQIKVFYAPHCRRPDTLASTFGSWVLFDRTIMAKDAGWTVANLRQMIGTRRCPNGLDHAFTQWRIADIAYRAALDHALTRPLQTIVTDHFSNRTLAKSGSMERMYLTRELGWTRWESWENLAIPVARNFDVVDRATKLRQSRRCDPRFHNAEMGDGWVMTDCREWTNIQPSARPEGDVPDFWIAGINAAKLFPISK
jgi:hypothetical protein